ncbi:uncharacterized protein LOC117174100 [Belonocnema kinseyi]|uniref:uncharacterized protein LOC117174100 n=1 Tax=Belonocnema kinseyi TaxID=2817044 RepID=UPI00143D1FE6|nr:uncharacterized protein LOC117174100 [Belonocnema kinseyi]
MIGKSEKDEENNSSSIRIKLITEKRQFLEDTSAQVQDEIKRCFKRLVDVLKSREIQLLRQVDAIHRQQLSVVQSNLELHSSIPSLIVNLSRAQDLEKEVSQFGKVELSDNCIFNDAEPYKAEDYQEANSDHVSFDKELQAEKTEKPSSVDPANQSNETKENILPSSSWDLNSTELLDIQLIDEDSDESSWVINSITSLLETSDCSLYSRDTENSIKENISMIEETNFVLQENKTTVDPDEKKEFCRNHNVSADDSEHPKQVQQWLQQILIETETEPTVPEIEQFSEIPKRVYVNFPLET